MGLVYLPTFTIKTTQMQVNRPYIEHLGMFICSDFLEDFWLGSLVWACIF